MCFYKPKRTGSKSLRLICERFNTTVSLDYEYGLLCFIFFCLCSDPNLGL